MHPFISGGISEFAKLSPLIRGNELDHLDDTSRGAVRGAKREAGAKRQIRGTEENGGKLCCVAKRVRNSKIKMENWGRRYLMFS